MAGKQLKCRRDKSASRGGRKGLGHKIKVLVVDDDAGVRLTVRAMQESAAVEVVGEAVDGQEAVVQAEVLEPDVILKGDLAVACAGREER